MNILDLKKGDKVFTGITRDGGFANNVEYIEEMEVRDIKVDLRNYEPDVLIRLAQDDIYVKVMRCKYCSAISKSVDDFKDGVFTEIPRDKVFYKHFAQIWGCNLDKYGDAIEVWRWDESKKQACKYLLSRFTESIFNSQLPEGDYPAKEACEKANKKMVTIEVTRTFLTEREEGADAEWLLNNPDEYEFEDGDECATTANYAD